MSFKESGFHATKTRWIAGASVALLLVIGAIFARQALRTTPPASAPARSGPARTRPILAPEQSRVAANFGNLPLMFEPNRGQSDGQVKFLSRNSHYNLFLTPDEAVFTLPVRSTGKDTNRSGIRNTASEARSQAVLRLQIHGANPSAKVRGDSMLAGHTNYLIGRDTSKWIHDIPQYARVNYQDVYPGVDLTFYGQQRQLEFDFIVKAGARPAAIGLNVEGAKEIALDDAGDLVLGSEAGDLRLHKPVAYQTLGGTRQPVNAQFVVRGTEVALAVGDYDRSRDLVIDPSIVYGTYLGAGNEDTGSAIAVDSTGAAYITGQTFSSGFPVKNQLPAPNNALQGTSDAFVTKMTADGTALVYSTFLGGTGLDSGNAIVIDGSGQAYIAGTTNSTDFPFPLSPPATTPFQGTAGGGEDAFVAVLNAAGNGLVYSTYIGGISDDQAEGIAVKGSVIYVAGVTGSDQNSFLVDLPAGSVLQATFQGGTGTSPTDGFVAKFDLSNTTNNAAVYLGGTGNDRALGVAVDASGNAYVTGLTFSTDFPVRGSAFQTQCGCTSTADDAFVTEINSTFTNYVYSTFLGGSGADIGNQIVVDGSGNAYVTGSTSSTNFPTNGSNAAYKTTLAGSNATNAFLTVVKPGGSSLLYSTYLGGTGIDTALAIALDSSNPAKAYITGQTSSSDFPTVNPTQPKSGGANDAFVSELNPNTSGTGSLVFSTYLGGSGDEDDELAGIAVDPNGNFYVTGDTQSITNFPVVPGSYKTTMSNSGGPNCTGVCRDAFVVKYSPATPQFNVSVGAISPGTISRGSNGTSTVTVTSTGSSGTVSLSCAILGSAAKPPTCSVGAPSGTLAANGSVTSTLTITTVSTGSASLTGAALWLPVPGLAVFGIGLVRNKGRKKLLWSLLCTFALAAILLMMGCGSGNVGGGGGGGGGGTTTGAYTVNVTAAVTGAGSQSGTAQFSVQ